MKRHFVAAIFLAVGLALPALAAEKSAGIGAAVKANPSKAPKKALATKKTDNPVKVAQVQKPGQVKKSPAKTTRRMHGYGS
jgi:hypothetical protein